MTTGFVPAPEVLLRRRLGKKWSLPGGDVLPAWVADMDAMPAPFVRDALVAAIDLGDLGYPPLPAESGVPESFRSWAERRWSWRVDPALVHLVPDVVRGIENCVAAFTRPGDGIVVQTPIYPPFLTTVGDLDRRVVANPLVDGRPDVQALSVVAAERRPSMLLLCNPHNPTGAVFTRPELEAIAEVALRHGLIVVSDEIHADLAYGGHRHVPFASLSPEVAARTVTLTSSSKAFNIAGLRLAVCVAGSADLLERILALPVHSWSGYSTLAVHATLAAWTDAGERWLATTVAHLDTMRERLATLLGAHAPSVGFQPPQASYLAWLDVTSWGLSEPAAAHIRTRAAVELSDGGGFGADPCRFVRMNFATSDAILTRIVERIAAVAPTARELAR